MTIEKVTLSTARKHAGLTQKKLANLCGVSVSTIANWENYKSEPTVSQAQMLGKICGINYDDIIFLPQNTVKP